MSASAADGRPAVSEAEPGDASAALPSCSVSLFKVASVLLQYPTTALFDGLDYVDATVAALSPRPARDAMRRFIAWLAVTPPNDVARHYVQTFDLRRRCALYLTYYRYGDTRKRGMAMLTFKAAYRSAGFQPTDAELPDYLPLVLDFAALHPPGAKLLRAHRADLELLRRALQQAESPYASVIEAICAQLPGLRKPDLALVARVWRDGPPAEEVGLEPFAPPGYLTGEARR